jgi:hypothetical protein
VEKGQPLRPQTYRQDTAKRLDKTFEVGNPEKVRIFTLGELLLETGTGYVRYFIFLGHFADGSHQGIIVAAG